MRDTRVCAPSLRRSEVVVISPPAIAAALSFGAPVMMDVGLLDDRGLARRRRVDDGLVIARVRRTTRTQRIQDLTGRRVDRKKLNFQVVARFVGAADEVAVGDGDGERDVVRARSASGSRGPAK